MDSIFIQIRNCIENQLEHGNSRFIIYPFGDVGTRVKEILNISYGITEAYLIDEKLCKYNANVKPLAFLEEIDCSEYVLILASTNRELYITLKGNALRYFKESHIEELACMKTFIFPLPKTKIGRYNYGPICHNDVLIESIGSFCSFVLGSVVVPNHEMQFLTTHPMIYADQTYEGISAYTNFSDAKWYIEGVQPKDIVKKRKRTKIGNDVWLGRNVIIIDGVNIGNGVIAGAGAVITRDVPDYAVVAGVPAKIIRYRYSPEQIDALNKIKWWDWTDDEIRERYDDFYLPVDEFISKYL